MDLGVNNWQFFWIQILHTLNDSNSGGENALSMSQTIPVTPGNHSMLKHCIDVDCASYVYFDYSLLEDGEECSSNPCQSGGTCIDGITSYSCNCLLQYTGSHCEQRNLVCPKPMSEWRHVHWSNWHLLACATAQSSILVILVNREGDAFLIHTKNGGICSEGPHSSRCTCPPEYTGTHCECKITVTLTFAESRCQPRYTSTRCERHNYCYPNHCRNGGRCINGLYSYTCRCPSTFIGTRCDYRIGRFQIYARYGRGLSDQDGW